MVIKTQKEWEIINSDLLLQGAREASLGSDQLAGELFVEESPLEKPKNEIVSLGFNQDLQLYFFNQERVSDLFSLPPEKFSLLDHRLNLFDGELSPEDRYQYLQSALKGYGAYQAGVERKVIHQQLQKLTQGFCDSLNQKLNDDDLTDDPVVSMAISWVDMVVDDLSTKSKKGPEWIFNELRRRLSQVVAFTELFAKAPFLSPNARQEILDLVNQALAENPGQVQKSLDKVSQQIKEIYDFEPKWRSLYPHQLSFNAIAFLGKKLKKPLSEATDEELAKLIKKYGYSSRDLGNRFKLAEAYHAEIADTIRVMSRALPALHLGSLAELDKLNEYHLADQAISDLTDPKKLALINHFITKYNAEEAPRRQELGEISAYDMNQVNQWQMTLEASNTGNQFKVQTTLFQIALTTQGITASAQQAMLGSFLTGKVFTAKEIEKLIREGFDFKKGEESKRYHLAKGISEENKLYQLADILLTNQTVGMDEWARTYWKAPMHERHAALLSGFRGFVADYRKGLEKFRKDITKGSVDPDQLKEQILKLGDLRIQRFLIAHDFNPNVDPYPNTYRRTAISARPYLNRLEGLSGNGRALMQNGGFEYAIKASNTIRQIEQQQDILARLIPLIEEVVNNDTWDTVINAFAPGGGANWDRSRELAREGRYQGIVKDDVVDRSYLKEQLGVVIEQFDKFEALKKDLLTILAETDEWFLTPGPLEALDDQQDVKIPTDQEIATLSAKLTGISQRMAKLSSAGIMGDLNHLLKQMGLDAQDRETFTQTSIGIVASFAGAGVGGFVTRLSYWTSRAQRMRAAINTSRVYQSAGKVGQAAINSLYAISAIAAESTPELLVNQVVMEALNYRYNSGERWDDNKSVEENVEGVLTRLGFNAINVYGQRLSRPIVHGTDNFIGVLGPLNRALGRIPLSFMDNEQRQLLSVMQRVLLRTGEYGAELVKKSGQKTIYFLGEGAIFFNLNILTQIAQAEFQGVQVDWDKVVHLEAFIQNVVDSILESTTEGAAERLGSAMAYVKNQPYIDSLSTEVRELLEKIKTDEYKGLSQQEKVDYINELDRKVGELVRVVEGHLHSQHDPTRKDLLAFTNSFLNVRKLQADLMVIQFLLRGAEQASIPEVMEGLADLSSDQDLHAKRIEAIRKAQQPIADQADLDEEGKAKEPEEIPDPIRKVVDPQDRSRMEWLGRLAEQGIVQPVRYQGRLVGYNYLGPKNQVYQILIDGTLAKPRGPLHPTRLVAPLMLGVLGYVGFDLTLGENAPYLALAFPGLEPAFNWVQSWVNRIVTRWTDFDQVTTQAEDLASQYYERLVADPELQELFNQSLLEEGGLRDTSLEVLTRQIIEIYRELSEEIEGFKPASLREIKRTIRMVAQLALQPYSNNPEQTEVSAETPPLLGIRKALEVILLSKFDKAQDRVRVAELIREKIPSDQTAQKSIDTYFEFFTSHTEPHLNKYLLYLVQGNDYRPEQSAPDRLDAFLSMTEQQRLSQMLNSCSSDSERQNLLLSIFSEENLNLTEVDRSKLLLEFAINHRIKVDQFFLCRIAHSAFSLSHDKGNQLIGLLNKAYWTAADLEHFPALIYQFRLNATNPGSYTLLNKQSRIDALSDLGYLGQNAQNIDEVLEALGRRDVIDKVFYSATFQSAFADYIESRKSKASEEEKANWDISAYRGKAKERFLETRAPQTSEVASNAGVLGIYLLGASDYQTLLTNHSPGNNFQLQIYHLLRQADPDGITSFPSDVGFNLSEVQQEYAEAFNATIDPHADRQTLDRLIGALGTSDLANRARIEADPQLKAKLDELVKLIPNQKTLAQGPATLETLEQLVARLLVNEPTILMGPTGVGKNAIVAYLAAQVGVPLVRVNFSRDTEEEDLHGHFEVVFEDYTDPETGEETQRRRIVVKDSAMIQAFEHGGWILWDELNLADPGLLVALNDIVQQLAGGTISVRQGGKIVEKSVHPDARLLASANPVSKRYGGRAEFEESFGDRWDIIQVRKPTIQDLTEMARLAYPDLPQPILDYILDIYFQAELELIDHGVVVTPRALFRILKRIKRAELDLSSVGERNSQSSRDWLENLDPAIRAVMIEAIEAEVLDGLDQQKFSEYATRFYGRNRFFDLTVEEAKSKMSELLGKMIESHSSSIDIPSEEVQQMNNEEDIQAIYNYILAAAGEIFLAGEGLTLRAFADLLAVTLGEVGSDTDHQATYQKRATEYREKIGQTDLPNFNSGNLAPVDLTMELGSKIIDSFLNGDDVLVRGDPATSKSAIVKEIANHVGQSYYELVGTPHMTIDDLIGSMQMNEQGVLEFVPSDFVRAIEAGCIIVINEANLIPPSVFEKLNSLFDDSGSIVVHVHGETKTYQRNSKTRIVMTENEETMKGSRVRHSDATLSKFRVIKLRRGFSNQELAEVIRHRYPELADYAEVMAEFFGDRLRSDNSFTLRDINRWITFCRTYQENLDYSLRQAIIASAQVVFGPQANQLEVILDRAEGRNEVDLAIEKVSEDPEARSEKFSAFVERVQRELRSQRSIAVVERSDDLLIHGFERASLEEQDTILQRAFLSNYFSNLGEVEALAKILGTDAGIACLERNLDDILEKASLQNNHSLTDLIRKAIGYLSKNPRGHQALEKIIASLHQDVLTSTDRFGNIEDFKSVICEALNGLSRHPQGYGLLKRIISDYSIYVIPFIKKYLAGSINSRDIGRLQMDRKAMQACAEIFWRVRKRIPNRLIIDRTHSWMTEEILRSALTEVEQTVRSYQSGQANLDHLRTSIGRVGEVWKNPELAGIFYQEVQAIIGRVGGCTELEGLLSRVYPASIPEDSRASHYENWSNFTPPHLVNEIMNAEYDRNYATNDSYQDQTDEGKKVIRENFLLAIAKIRSGDRDGYARLNQMIEFDQIPDQATRSANGIRDYREVVMQLMEENPSEFTLNAYVKFFIKITTDPRAAAGNFFDETPSRLVKLIQTFDSPTDIVEQIIVQIHRLNFKNDVFTHQRFPEFYQFLARNCSRNLSIFLHIDPAERLNSNFIALLILLNTDESRDILIKYSLKPLLMRDFIRLGVSPDYMGEDFLKRYQLLSGLAVKVVAHASADPSSRAPSPVVLTIEQEVEKLVNALEKWQANSKVQADPVLRAEVEKLIPETKEIIWTASTLEALRAITVAIIAGEPIYLEGATGRGKTSLIQYLAHQTGSPLYRFGFSENTDRSSLEGQYEVKLIPSSDGSPPAKRIVWKNGPLIQALECGGWILFDEMNLADPGFLVSLNELIEQIRNGEKVWVKKDGKVQQITPDPQVRLFATGNPASYIGRKPLERSVDSRWHTHPMADYPAEELREILTTRYPQVANEVIDLIIDVCESLKLEIFSREGQLNIRTLDRVVSRINTAKTNGTDFFQRGSDDAILTDSNGHHVLSATGLGIIAKALEAEVLDSLDERSYPSALALLKVHLSTDIESYLTDRNQLTKDDLGDAIAGYRSVLELEERSLAKEQTSALTPDRKSIEDSSLIPTVTTLEYALKVLDSLTRNDLLLLEGPPSRSKSAIIEWIGELTGQRVKTLTGSVDTSVMDLIGMPRFHADGSIEFEPGPLLVAMMRGEILTLNEVNVIPTSVLERLNSLFDDDRSIYVIEDGVKKYIKPHPSFRLVLTQNPASMNGGRRPLSPATENKFRKIYFRNEFQESEIAEIISNQNPEFADYATVMAAMFQGAREVFRGSNEELTLRDLKRWTELSRGLMVSASMTPVEALIYGAELVLDSRVTSDQQKGRVDSLKTNLDRDLRAVQSGTRAEVDKREVLVRKIRRKIVESNKPLKDLIRNQPLRSSTWLKTVLIGKSTQEIFDFLTKLKNDTEVLGDTSIAEVLVTQFPEKIIEFYDILDREGLSNFVKLSYPQCLELFRYYVRVGGIPENTPPAILQAFSEYPHLVQELINRGLVPEQLVNNYLASLLIGEVSGEAIILVAALDGDVEQVSTVMNAWLNSISPDDSSPLKVLKDIIDSYSGGNLDRLMRIAPFRNYIEEKFAAVNEAEIDNTTVFEYCTFMRLLVENRSKVAKKILLAQLDSVSDPSSVLSNQHDVIKGINLSLLLNYYPDNEVKDFLNKIVTSDVLEGHRFEYLDDTLKGALKGILEAIKAQDTTQYYLELLRASKTYSGIFFTEAMALVLLKTGDENTILEVLSFFSEPSATRFITDGMAYPDSALGQRLREVFRELPDEQQIDLLKNAYSNYNQILANHLRRYGYDRRTSFWFVEFLVEEAFKEPATKRDLLQLIATYPEAVDTICAKAAEVADIDEEIKQALISHLVAEYASLEVEVDSETQDKEKLGSGVLAFLKRYHPDFNAEVIKTPQLTLEVYQEVLAEDSDPLVKASDNDPLADATKKIIEDSSQKDEAPDLSSYIPEAVDLVETPTIAHATKAMRSAIIANIPFLIEGETGTGKTTIVRQEAARLGQPLFRINFDPDTELDQLLGMYEIQTVEVKVKNDRGEVIDTKHERRVVFKERELVTAIRYGAWVLFDEFNLANPAVAIALNDIIQAVKTGKVWVKLDNEIVEIDVDPRFRLFATTNPPSYAGRKKLEASARDRWLKYPMGNFSSAELEAIITRRFGVGEDLSRNLVGIYEKIKLESFSNDGRFTLRTLNQIALRIIDELKNRSISEKDLFQRDEAGNIVQNDSGHDLFSDIGVKILVSAFEAEVLDAADNREILSLRNLLSLSIGASQGININDYLSENNIPSVEQTKKALSAYRKQLEASAADNNRSLVEDSGLWSDIALVPTVRHYLNKVLDSLLRNQVVLLEGPPAYGKTSIPKTIAKKVGQRVVEMTGKPNLSVFELIGMPTIGEDGQIIFQPGPLLDALESGSLFILNEMNVVPSSVIERINSLLDDDRALYVKESGSLRKVKPHPNFRMVITQNPPSYRGSRRKYSPALNSKFRKITLRTGYTKEEVVYISLKTMYEELGIEFKGEMPERKKLDGTDETKTSVEIKTDSDPKDGRAVNQPRELVGATVGSTAPIESAATLVGKSSPDALNSMTRGAEELHTVRRDGTNAELTTEQRKQVEDRIRGLEALIDTVAGQSIRITIDDETNSASMDGYGNMRFNPKYMHKLSDEGVLGLILHEAAHSMIHFPMVEEMHAILKDRQVTMAYNCFIDPQANQFQAAKFREGRKVLGHTYADEKKALIDDGGSGDLLPHKQFVHALHEMWDLDGVIPDFVTDSEVRAALEELKPVLLEVWSNHPSPQGLVRGSDVVLQKQREAIRVFQEKVLPKFNDFLKKSADQMQGDSSANGETTPNNGNPVDLDQLPENVRDKLQELADEVNEVMQPHNQNFDKDKAKLVEGDEGPKPSQQPRKGKPKTKGDELADRKSREKRRKDFYQDNPYREALDPIRDKADALVEVFRDMFRPQGSTWSDRRFASGTRLDIKAAIKMLIDDMVGILTDQSLKIFRRQVAPSERHPRIVLAVDVSGSTAGYDEYVQSAVLFQYALKELGIDHAVITFSDTTTVQKSFDQNLDDMNKLNDFAHNVGQTEGGTNDLKAIETADGLFDNKDGKRMVIGIGVGENASNVTEVYPNHFHANDMGRLLDMLKLSLMSSFVAEGAPEDIIIVITDGAGYGEQVREKVVEISNRGNK